MPEIFQNENHTHLNIFGIFAELPKFGAKVSELQSFLEFTPCSSDLETGEPLGRRRAHWRRHRRHRNHLTWGAL